MNRERLVLCRPQGGLNDMLCQIEKACRYGERFGRTVVVDTNYHGARFFRDRFSRYFVSRQPGLVLEAEGFGDYLDQATAFPRFLTGRLTTYPVRHDKTISRHVDAETGLPISFDFNADYDEAVLVHHEAGGGRVSLHALARMRVHDGLLAVLRERLAIVGPRYTGVHIRNTDYRTPYDSAGMFANIDPVDPVFVATDDANAIAHVRARLGEQRVHAFAELPEAGGGPIHRMPEPRDAYPLNRDAIVDLLMLALATRLHMYELEPNSFGVRFSGYSVLAADLRNHPQVLDGLVSAAAAGRDPPG